MKQHQHRRGSTESLFIDPDFADALCEGDSGNRPSARRQAERKTWQFCRQVQQALNLALAGCEACQAINDLFVEEVTPAPDCGRLLAYVVIPAGRPVAEAIAALGRQTPRLRSEVATMITRKRAPELCFVPVHPEQGGPGDDE